MIYIENLSKTIEQSINKLKNIFKIINENKEKVKIEIQNIFTILRNEINKRENEILIEFDAKLMNFFQRKINSKKWKITKKTSESLQIGKFEEND